VTEVAHLPARRRYAIPAAVGVGNRIRGRSLVIRLLLLGLIATLAAGTLWLKTNSRGDANALPPLPGAARVTPNLVRGGQPADFDLLQLRNAYRVRAVVNLRFGGDAEGEIAAGFGLDFLSLPVAVDEAPTVADLATLVGFLRRYDSGSAVVYLHDDIGGGRVITTSLMLLLLRGEPLGVAMSTLRPEEQRMLSAHQWSALVTLSQAVAERGAGNDNAYREAAVLRW
jgi:hypothetical protein